MRVTLFDTLARSLFGHFNVCKFSLCSKPLFIVVVPSFFPFQTINKKRTQLPQLAYRDFGGRKNIRLKTNRTASTRWDCVSKCNKTRHGQYLNKHNQPNHVPADRKRPVDELKNTSSKCSTYIELYACRFVKL